MAEAGKNPGDGPATKADGTPATAPTTETTAGVPPKVTFTAEQQARIQELIDEAHERAFKKFSETAKKQEKKQEHQSKDVAAEDHEKAIAAIKAEHETQLVASRKELADLRGHQINAEIARHAAGTHNPLLVAQALADQVHFVDGAFEVRTPKGTAAIGADGRHLDVGGLVKQYLDRNPWLVRAPGTPGSVGAIPAPDLRGSAVSIPSTASAEAARIRSLPRHEQEAALARLLQAQLAGHR